MLDMLAQAAPSIGVTLPDLYGEIARTGLVGVLFVLVVYALIKRDKDLTAERAARLADALAMRDMVEADTEARTAAIKLQEEHNRLQETVARNQELIAQRIENLTKSVERRP